MNVLELYSGIGGMHLALNESGAPGEVKAAVDINNTANSVYRHNFPDTLLLNYNIEGLNAEKITKLNVNTILMSPPCQPFSRNGLQNDVKDSRTDSFQHFLTLLPELNLIKNILVENVEGFEQSIMRDILIKKLSSCGFIYQEFILNPNEIGVPNSRPRYYCLAKKAPERFGFDTTRELMRSLPLSPNQPECFQLDNITEKNLEEEKFKIATNILRKRFKTLDICYPTSTHSCCFTKSYGRYIKGSGSVFCRNNESETSAILERIQNSNEDSEEYLETIESLNLRFFSPREVCRLMCFPETFTFPTDISIRQQYMVLGNSINVKVVSELIKLF